MLSLVHDALFIGDLDRGVSEGWHYPALSVHELLCSRLYFHHHSDSGIHFPASYADRVYLPAQFAHADQHDFSGHIVYSGGFRFGAGWRSYAAENVRAGVVQRERVRAS